MESYVSLLRVSQETWRFWESKMITWQESGDNEEWGWGNNKPGEKKSKEEDELGENEKICMMSSPEILSEELESGEGLVEILS